MTVTWQPLDEVFVVKEDCGTRVDFTAQDMIMLSAWLNEIQVKTAHAN